MPDSTEKNRGGGNAIQPGIRLYFSKDTRIFGPGMYELLCLIEQTGSVSSACNKMGISYSKGWKRIATLEEQLEVTIVDRKRGGAVKGESHVTETGKNLMACYETVLKECQEQMERSFAKQYASIQKETAL